MFLKMVLNLENKIDCDTLNDIEIVPCRSLFDVIKFTICHIICFNHKWYEFLKYLLCDLCKESYLVLKSNLLVGGFSIVLCEEPYLYDFMILPKYHKKGIGKSVLKKLISFLNGYSFLYLYVEKSNIPAICLYKQIGFYYVE